MEDDKGCCFHILTRKAYKICTKGSTTLQDIEKQLPLTLVFHAVMMPNLAAR